MPALCRINGPTNVWLLSMDDCVFLSLLSAHMLASINAGAFIPPKERDILLDSSRVYNGYGSNYCYLEKLGLSYEIF